MIIGNREFDTKHHTYVMGILNATPDSFSDGGRYNCVDAALYHAEQMIRDGADIIDVGGESTRPGYQQISEEEEIERVVPVIEAIGKRFDIPISIDTYKSKVAEAAIVAGADMVNDIWGLKYDPKMAETIARTGAVCCIMHNRTDMDYNVFLTDMLWDLDESLKIAKQAGISQDKIILDPGVGFAKTYEMNLAVLKQLKAVNRLGYPVLLGTSRKSVIGLTLDTPADQREEGTLVTTVFAVQNHYGFVRVHDVLANKRAIMMTEAILHAAPMNK